MTPPEAIKNNSAHKHLHICMYVSRIVSFVPHNACPEFDLMCSLPGSEEEEEGLHGVFKRLRRNGHQLKCVACLVHGCLLHLLTCMYVLKIESFVPQRMPRVWVDV
jgi:hypothetical protein